MKPPKAPSPQGLGGLSRVLLGSRPVLGLTAVIIVLVLLLADCKSKVASGTSKHVSREMTPDVVPALARALKAGGVGSALLLGCAAKPLLAASFDAAGLKATCINSEADADAFTSRVRPGSVAVVQLRRVGPSSPGQPIPVPSPALAERLLAAAGGADVVAYGEVQINGTTAQRALLVRPRRWAASSSSSGGSKTFSGGGGSVTVWFRETSVFLDAFNLVYKSRKWTDEGGGSGIGSSLQYTEDVRRALPGIIRKYGITSMLDSSCGSMHWMPLVLQEVEKEQPGFRFHGSDVVCPLIEQHKKTYAAKPAYSFSCVDYANQPLAPGYDLVWSRDSLQHVPLHAAWQFLNNVRASGAKYLLVGSYLKRHENIDIPAGEYYSINLLDAPFKLRPEPLMVIDERSEVHENNIAAERKFMLLFDMRTLQWDDALSDL